MYKALLVDDDYPVLEFLSMTVPWASLGIELLGTAKDGLKALEIMKHTMPDLLITDIGMPKMNGIELIEKGKAANPRLISVILSCHDNFCYAQQALKFNVNDYLLKESMSSEQIVSLLQGIVRKLNEENRVLESNGKLARTVHQNQSALKEKWLKSLLASPLLNNAEWSEHMLEYGVDMRQPYLPILCSIDRMRNLTERFHSSEFVNYAAENLLEECLLKYEAVCFRYSLKEFMILFPYRDSILHNRYDKIETPLRDIQVRAFKYIKVALSFFIGKKTVCDPISFKEGVFELLHTENQRFYLDQLTLERLEHLPDAFSDNDIFEHYVTAIEQFRCSVFGESNYWQATVSYWIDFIRNQRYHPDEVKSFFLKIVLDLQVKIKSMDHFKSFSTEVLHRCIVETESIFELKKWLLEYFEKVEKAMSTISQHSKRKEIVKALKYMAQNLQRKITLEEMADYLHLNQSYFSRMFKKVMNETFIDYVTRMKMERAKELLDASDLSVEKIAYMLGYDSKSYFNKLFRVYYGVAPSEYVKDR